LAPPIVFQAYPSAKSGFSKSALGTEEECNDEGFSKSALGTEEECNEQTTNQNKTKGEAGKQEEFDEDYTAAMKAGVTGGVQAIVVSSGGQSGL
jgi:hypothetical protein